MASAVAEGGTPPQLAEAATSWYQPVGASLLAPACTHLQAAHHRFISTRGPPTAAGADVLFVAILETKEVSAALAEAGINAKQLASAVEEGRGSIRVDSATADTQVGLPSVFFKQGQLMSLRGVSWVPTRVAAACG